MIAPDPYKKRAYQVLHVIGGVAIISTFYSWIYDETAREILFTGLITAIIMLSLLGYIIYLAKKSGRISGD